jgi:ribosomal protein S18 acetylase RimI-like enzyme
MKLFHILTSKNILLSLLLSIFLSNFKFIDAANGEFLNYNPDRDAQSIHELFKEHAKFLFESGEYNPKAVNYMLKTMKTKVLYENNELKGFIIYLIEKLGNFCYIAEIAIKTDEQRKGYGSNMVQHILNYFKEQKCDRITTNINKNNKAMISLVKKFDFKEEDEKNDLITFSIDLK